MSLLDSILGNSYIVVYAICLIIGLFRHVKYFETPLRYFPILILYTLLNETLGVLIGNYGYFDLSFEATYKNYNIVIYAIYNIIFFLYFYYLYWNYTKIKKHKKRIIIIGIVFCLAAIINMFFQDITAEHQILTYFTGAITLIYCALYYLKKLPKSEREKNLLFWISMGLVIFHVGYLPIKLIRQFHIEGLNYIIIWRIHMLLILAMYTCFIIGFIKMKRMKPIREEN